MVALNLAHDLAALRQHPALRQQPLSPRRYWRTGIDELDAFLGGGLPLGVITELIGEAARSAGRTSLALAVLAAATRRGEWVAWIDVQDSLDPLSLAAAGAELSRFLWVRCFGRDAAKQALQAADIIVAAGGFTAVGLDFVGAPRPTSLPQASFVRLARRLEVAKSALLVLANQELAGSAAAVRLGCHWRVPAHELELTVHKQRGAALGGTLRLVFGEPVD